MGVVKDISAVVITRRIEFDAGHRIPDHKSKCRNLHGHRYVLEATIGGVVNPRRVQSDDGMITDFADLKQIMVKVVGEPWDHAFLYYSGDKEVAEALAQFRLNQKQEALLVAPTVENLARLAFDRIHGELETSGAPFVLRNVRLYETPNCWADATGGI